MGLSQLPGCPASWLELHPSESFQAQRRGGFGVGERNPSFLTQGAASRLLASSHEVFLILGIKTLGNVTLSCLARLLPLFSGNTLTFCPLEPSQQPHPHSPER